MTIVYTVDISTFLFHVGIELLAPWLSRGTRVPPWRMCIYIYIYCIFIYIYIYILYIYIHCICIYTVFIYIYTYTRREIYVLNLIILQGKGDCSTRKLTVHFHFDELAMCDVFFSKVACSYQPSLVDPLGPWWILLSNWLCPSTSL